MKKAPGRHPEHVTAHIITAEEKKRMLGQSGNSSNIQTQIIPGGLRSQTDVNVRTVAPKGPIQTEAENENQDELLITGKAAIKVAKNVGSDHVWVLETGDPISLEEAEKLGDAVYFDFVVFDAETEDETDEDFVSEYLEPGDEEGNEISSAGDITPTPQEQGEALLARDQLIPTPPSETAGSLVDPSQMVTMEDEPPMPAERTGNKLVTAFFEKGLRNTRLNEMPIEQRREMSWGAVLSAPGLQVYMHPQGIVRVNLDGKIRIQKAIEGNVRVLRLTRLEKTAPKPNIIPSQNPTTRTFQNQNTVTAKSVTDNREEPESDATEF